MKTNSFKKTDRIRKSSEYRYLTENGKRFNSNNILIVFNTNLLQKPRLGITVSKKVGNAVIRNRIKRIIREQFRTKRIFLSVPMDINIIVKKQAKAMKTTDFKDELKSCVISIGRIKNING